MKFNTFEVLTFNAFAFSVTFSQIQQMAQIVIIILSLGLSCLKIIQDLNNKK